MLAYNTSAEAAANMDRILDKLRKGENVRIAGIDVAAKPVKEGTPSARAEAIEKRRGKPTRMGGDYADDLEKIISERSNDLLRDPWE